MTPKLGFPVFDADNHMYETTEALTKFLPDRVPGRDRLRRGRRPHQDRHPRDRSASTSPTRPSTWSPRRAPRRTTSSNGNPEGKIHREIMGKPIEAIPAFATPRPGWS